MAKSYPAARTSMLDRGLRISAFVLGCLWLSACSMSSLQSTFAAGQGSFEKNVAVEGPISLDAYTASGDINVRRGGAAVVHVVGHAWIYRSWWSWSGISPQEALARLQANPPVEAHGNAVRVGYIDDPDLTRQIAISYEIQVPATTSAVVRISSGSTTVDGLDGPVEASTSTGRVALSNIKGRVQASSSSGGVDLHSIGGPATISVSSGFIHGSDLVATNARTSSGDVTLNQVRGACEVFVSSGSINVDGSPIAPWHLSVTSGPLNLRVNESSHFELRAHVSSGGIHNALPITTMRSASSNLLIGSVGGGGPVVELSAESGHISIE